MSGKNAVGRIDFDFLEMIERSKVDGFGLPISVAKWHTEMVTILREPIATNIKQVYDLDTNTYNQLIDLALKFKVKFNIEDLEEVGVMGEEWDNYFGFISDYDTVISNTKALTLTEKITRIDALLKRDKVVRLRVDELDGIPNLTNFLDELRDSNLRNFEVPRIVRLSDLGTTDAIEIVKILKEKYNGFDFSINPLSLKTKVMSTIEIEEIMILCVKNGISARVDGNQKTLSNVNKGLYFRMYKDGITKTIDKFIEEFNGDFVYSQSFLDFFRVKLSHHPELSEYYLLERVESDVDGVQEIDVKNEAYKHTNLDIIDENTFTIQKRLVDSKFIYLIPTFFVIGDMDEESKKKYEGFNWNKYI